MLVTVIVPLIIVGATVSANMVAPGDATPSTTLATNMGSHGSVCPGTWKAPSIVLAAGDILALLHSLSTSADGRGPTYLMVSTIGAQVTRRPLKVFAVGGIEVGAPKGDFEFAFPQGAVDGHGRLHMVWGEPDSLESREIADWMTMRVHSLWTSTYDPAHRSWSVPARLHRTKWSSISWTRANAVTWSDGRAMLAASVPLPDVPSGRGPLPSGYVILLQLDSSWRGRTMVIPGQRMPGIASAIRLVDRTVVAIGGPRVNEDSDLRVVIVRDRTPSVELESPRRGHIENLRLFDAGAGRLHLVWKEADAQGVSSLAHVAVQATTGTWSAPTERAIGRATGNERYAMDSCGVIHATLEMTSDDGGFGLFDVRFNGAWQSPERLLPFVQPHNADIIALGDGTMTLGFQGALSGPKGGSLIARYSR